MRLEQDRRRGRSPINGNGVQGSTKRFSGTAQQTGHRQGDALQGRPGNLRGGGVTGHANQQAPGVGIPVGGSPAGEGRHEHQFTRALHPGGQGIHLGGLADDPQAIAQPLDHGPSIEEAALNAIGGAAVGVAPTDRAQQPPCSPLRAKATVHHQESARAVGALRLARFKAELAITGRLLVTQHRRDGGASEGKPLGDHGKGTAGRQQFREGSGRQSDALDRVRQPAQLLQVQEQRSTGIADVGGMARSAAEVPEQPAVDGAKTEVIGG